MGMKMKKYVYEADTQSGGIRKRLKTPMLVSFVFMILGFSGIITYIQNNHFTDKISSKVQAVESVLKSNIDIDIAAINGFIDLIKKNDAIKKALISEDRALLLEQSKGFYAVLNRDFSLTHFYFHNRSRSNILRVHKPSQFGDKINRITALEAEKTGVNAHGVEPGAIGQFTLRVVSPWFDDRGKLIGYIELGEEIEHIIEGVSKLMGLDIVSFVNKEILDQASWTKNSSAHNRQDAQWNDYERGAMVYSTLKKHPNELREYIQKIDQGGNVFTEKFLSWNNQKHAVSTIDLLSENEKDLGKYVLIMDSDSEFSAILNSILTTTILIVLIGILLYRALSKFVNNIELSLLSSEEKNRAFVESTVDGIFTFDFTGRIQACNPAGLTMFGYREQAEVMALNINALLPDPFDRRHDEYFEREREATSENFNNNVVEAEGKRLDGSVIPIHLSMSEIRIGEIVFFTALVRNISAEKAEKEALLAHRDRLQRILDEQTASAIINREAERLNHLDLVG